MSTNDPGMNPISDPAPAAIPLGSAPLVGLATVVGVFDSADQAHSAAADLVAAGCAPDTISLALPGTGEVPPRQVGAEGSPEDRGALTGVSVGALVGGAAGLIALAIPGIGPILAAGPLAAALGGAATGGILGGLIGSIAGLGVPHDHAERYEAAVRGGGVLLAAQVPPAGAAGVAQILADHGARDVAHH